MSATKESLLFSKMLQKTPSLKKQIGEALQEAEFERAVDLLKQEPALVNTKLGIFSCRKPIFHIATSSKLDPKIVHKLIELGANLNEHESDCTALDRFIKTGYLYCEIHKSSFKSSGVYKNCLESVKLMASVGGQYNKNIIEHYKSKKDYEDECKYYKRFTEDLMVSLEQGYQIYEKSQQERRTAFLMGAHPRLGKNSAIHREFLDSEISDFKNLSKKIFKFV